MSREEYKFRATDFIPILGMCKYENRTCHTKVDDINSDDKLLTKKIERRVNVLIGYNTFAIVSMVSGLGLGLEKFLK